MSVMQYVGVRKCYGDFVALEGLDLEVRRGEVFGLLGPNGAGKTTMIRIGLDILRPDEGEVHLFGEKLSRASLSRVAYLPEERGLYRKTKVMDVLVYLGTLKGLTRTDARRRAGEWLERIGLSHVAHKKCDALSKGMNQKVQLVAALFTDPELCVLDEPFSGLDPSATASVKDLIRERSAQGRATILSTHMMNQVEALCERVAIIHQGKRVVYGTTDDVRQEFSAEEVIVRCEGTLPSIEGVIVREDAQGDVATLPEGMRTPDYVGALVEAGAEITELHRRLATMEEIFLRVTAAA